MKAECTVADCRREHHARGLCAPHYKRMVRTVSPDPPPLAHEVPPCCVCDDPRGDVLGQCRRCGRPTAPSLARVRQAWRDYYRQRGWPVNVR